MLIRRIKYHSDISAAYEKGLEQGFELARKIRRIREAKRQKLCSIFDMHQSEASSLLLRQLVDITGRKGIDLE